MFQVLGRQLVVVLGQILERLAEKARRAAGAVIDALADLRLDHLDHGADERTRRVILATVAPGIAHVAELRLVEMRELVLFLLRAEAELIDQFQRVAQRIAAAELVFDLREDFADLVFDGVGTLGAGAEALQVGKQLVVDVLDEIVAGQRLVVIERAVLLLRRRPHGPAVLGVDDRLVFLARQLGLLLVGALKVVEILEKQNPGGLLGVVQLRGAAGLFPQNVVDVLEGLFEHSSSPQ